MSAAGKVAEEAKSAADHLHKILNMLHTDEELPGLRFLLKCVHCTGEEALAVSANGGKVNSY